MKLKVRDIARSYTGLSAVYKIMAMSLRASSPFLKPGDRQPKKIIYKLKGRKGLKRQGRVTDKNMEIKKKKKHGWNIN